MARVRIFDLELVRASRSRNVRPEVPVPTGIQTSPLFFPGFGPTPLQSVHEMQVLGLPAANRAVQFIANGVSSMAPMRAFLGSVDDEDGFEKVTPTPNICERPNATLGTFAFWHMAVCAAIMRGNFVGLLADFDGSGYPRQAVPVPLDIWDVHYDANGFIVHEIGGVTYSALDVVHVPYFLLPGSPRGLGVVEMFRRSLAHALEQQHLAADTYSRASVPSGTLTTDKPNPDVKQVQELKEQWVDTFGRGQRAPAVLPRDWKFEPISWSPEDAQFLQSRQFTVGEVALMFGLDPSDLGAALSAQSGSLTYANIEQRQIGRTTDAYGPVMRRFEDAWTDLLPANQRAAFVPERIFRMDAKTRAEVDKLDTESGVVTVDEARAGRRLPPLPESEKKPEPMPAQLDGFTPPAPNGNGAPATSEANGNG